MPTLILDIELEGPLMPVEPPPAYDELLLILRRHGRPVAQRYVPARSLETPHLEALRAALGAGTAPAPPPPPISRPTSVAICTRDRPRDLSRALEGVAALPDDGQEYLVVDSASRGEATRRVVEGFPGVRYVRVARPGLDVARNLALREARGEIVAFLDDDAIPEADWLRALVDPFDDPAVACVTGLTLPLELESPAQRWFERYSSFNRGFERVIYDRARLDPLAAGRVGAGANMALRRALVPDGGFDEALDAGTATRSGGDTELFSRVLAAGHRIVYEPAAVARHRHRREWGALRGVIHGYGIGVYAFWSRRLLVEREWRVLPLAASWLLRYQLPALARSLLRRPGSTPPDLLLAELAGCARGPWAYLSSRSATRRE